MTDDFAAPPAPDGKPSGTVRREEFRPAPQARRRGRFPRWVVVLLGLGLLVIVGGVVAQVALTVRASHLAAAPLDATGRLHSAQVVSGMCIEELRDEAAPVVVVDCSEPHSAEAVTAFLFDGDDWPGDAKVASTMTRYCSSQLDGDGPLAMAAQGRTWVAWVPSEGTWRAGDRTGLCIVTSDTPWVGSATEVEEHAEA